MIHKLLHRYGVKGATLILSVIAVAVSSGITALATYLVEGSIGLLGMALGIGIPAVIAPVFAYSQLHLLQALDSLHAQLRNLAETDELTQAHNRRYFFQEAERRRKQAAETRESFSILIFDMDDFKSINDRFGHQAGDQVLQWVSRTCMSSIRPTDLFARYGGEEFVLLLPGLDADDCQRVAERLRQILAETPIELVDPAKPGQPAFTIHVSASMGAVCVRGGVADLNQLLKLADDALSRAKAGGKNRLIFVEHGE